MPPPLILDPASLDLSRPIMDLEGIRKVNPQRFEMEQLTAVVMINRDDQTVATYKDVRADEFWVRGHMPDYPLMPGVLICEAAAQTCAIYVRTVGLLGGDFIAFGGMENVRFRDVVRLGDRLVLIARVARVKSRQATFQVQGFVRNAMVFQGDIIGVPFMRDKPAPATEGA